jgi:3-dehydrotetronate 4-kinase
MSLFPGSIANFAGASHLAAVSAKFSMGVGGLVIADGETSGATIKALGIRQPRAGPEICPRILRTAGEARAHGPLALAPTSGNFEASDFP